MLSFIFIHIFLQHKIGADHKSSAAAAAVAAVAAVTSTILNSEEQKLWPHNWLRKATNKNHTEQTEYTKK